MISIRNAADEWQVGELVLSETYFSIRVGGDGWGAGVAYRAPRSVSQAGRRVPIRDYIMSARVISLVVVVLFVITRRVSN